MPSLTRLAHAIRRAGFTTPFSYEDTPLDVGPDNDLGDYEDTDDADRIADPDLLESLTHPSISALLRS